MEAPSKLSISDMEADGRSGTRSRITPAKTPVSSSGPRIAADNQRWECRGQDAGVWGISPGDRYVGTPPFPQQARLNSSLEVPDAEMRPVLLQIPGSLLIGVLSYAGVGRVLQNIMAFLSSHHPDQLLSGHVARRMQAVSCNNDPCLSTVPLSFFVSLQVCKCPSSRHLRGIFTVRPLSSCQRRRIAHPAKRSRSTHRRPGVHAPVREVALYLLHLRRLNFRPQT